MNSEQIRKLSFAGTTTGVFLREIAAQLAEANEMLRAERGAETGAEHKPGFICAAWKRVTEGPLHARRTLVYRCDEPDGHEGRHCDNVLGFSWLDEDSELECRPRNELNAAPAFPPRFHRQA